MLAGCDTFQGRAGGEAWRGEALFFSTRYTFACTTDGLAVETRSLPDGGTETHYGTCEVSEVGDAFVIESDGITPSVPRNFRFEGMRRGSRAEGTICVEYTFCADITMNLSSGETLRPSMEKR